MIRQAFGVEALTVHGKSKLTETGEDQSQEHAHNFFSLQENCSKKESVLAGQTVNSAYCGDILRRLRENVRRLRAKHFWRQKNCLLHHDNAQSHTSFFHQGMFYHEQHYHSPSLTLLFCFFD
jgi:hypothetical protein